LDLTTSLHLSVNIRLWSTVLSVIVLLILYAIT
jgi:hypothetical protein